MNSVNKSGINQKGSILPLAVVMIVILAIIGLGLIRLGLNARLLAIHETGKLAARAAADAGLSHAMQLMRAKDANELIWDNSTLPPTTTAAFTNISYQDARYTCDVNGDPNSGWQINSTGTAGNATKTVHCKLIPKSLWFGIGVKKGIDVKLGAKFGTVPVAGGQFKLATNSTTPDSIVLKAGVTIPGDIVIGPGGNPDTVINDKSTTVITGTTYPSEMSMQFPSVIVPADLLALAPTAYVNDPCGITGDVRYNGMTIAGYQQVVGITRLFIDGKMTMGNGAELYMAPGSSLTVYLNGNMEDKNSAGITNATNDATKFLLYATDNCTQVDLKAKTDFYGAVYAPNATLTIYNNGDLYGAYVGNQNVEMKNSGGFYFDTRLLSVFMSDQQHYLGIERWWED